MKIAILVSEFPPDSVGGTETQSYHMARHLAKSHEVIILTRRVQNRKREEYIEGFRVKRLWYLDIPVLRLITHIASALLEIKREKKNIDLLQCMIILPNGVIGALAKKCFSIPCITWVRTDFRIESTGVLNRFLSSFAIKNSDLVLTQAESIRAQILKEFPRLKIKVIPNAIEFPEEVSNGNKILYVGRLVKSKGVRYLIEALKRIPNHPETLIIGDGPERKSLERMSKGHNVKFVGRVLPEYMPKYYKQGKLLVLPSLVESMPNVILEAMSYGLPVISTRVGGIPEIIKHEETGFIVDPRDVDNLARYIEILLKDEKLREIMRKNCLREIKKYSWEAFIEKVEKAYREVTS
jgi:glycosyltransferase involved in cell wall biosynthesis